MLLKIREKSQGIFAWVILVLICVPFALWGIQNYVGGGTEASVVTVGDKSFFQQDINQAYNQYIQRFAGQKFDEEDAKKQMLEKLIRDEILWQHADNMGLVATNDASRDFVKGLKYFQSDDTFDEERYQAMLASQKISQHVFFNRIKKTLVMEQFQNGIIESAFATAKDLENFFKIQNQTRDAEIISIELEPVKNTPTQAEIEEYYQENQSNYLTKEQASIEYVQLSLANLAKNIHPTDEQLTTYFEEKKELYTNKERRKISHILFSFTKDGKDEEQLKRATDAEQALQHKSFAELAKAISDDKLTADKGGDLGLFNVGVMEKAFEEAASSLQLGEVSAPIKSSFGYHLIKVTELVPASTKAFDAVKQELTIAYQRLEAENEFYDLEERLSQVSYENSDDLTASAELLEASLVQTSFFGKHSVASPITENASQPIPQTAIITHAAVIEAAFSTDVLAGSNSEVIKLSSDNLLVLRMLEHKPSSVKAIDEVRDSVALAINDKKSRAVALEKMQHIKAAVAGGKSMQVVAEASNVEMQHFPKLERADGTLSWSINQAIFKATKPSTEKPTLVDAAEPSGTQTVINVLGVTEGVMSESDKEKQELAKKNIATLFGQSGLKATLDSLRSRTDVAIKSAEE